MFDATGKPCVFSKDQSGAEFKSVANPTVVVKSRAGWEGHSQGRQGREDQGFPGHGAESVWSALKVSRKASRPSV